jgi:hypothetical protein
VYNEVWAMHQYSATSSLLNKQLLEVQYTFNCSEFCYSYLGTTGELIHRGFVLEYQTLHLTPPSHLHTEASDVTFNSPRSLTQRGFVRGHQNQIAGRTSSAVLTSSPWWSPCASGKQHCWWYSCLHCLLYEKQVYIMYIGECNIS